MEGRWLAGIQSRIAATCQSVGGLDQPALREEKGIHKSTEERIIATQNAEDPKNVLVVLSRAVTLATNRVQLSSPCTRTWSAISRGTVS